VERIFFLKKKTVKYFFGTIIPKKKKEKKEKKNTCVSFSLEHVEKILINPRLAIYGFAKFIYTDCYFTYLPF
jgi:hypothetical protein